MFHDRRYVYHGGEVTAWLQEQEADDHILIHTQEAEQQNRKWGKAINPESPPLGCT